MNLIHLRYYHTATKPVEHPLLDACEPVSEAELDQMVSDTLLDSSTGERLVLALRSSLRHMVSRYLGNFPESAAFTDDMVSEGFLAICELVENLSLDLLNGRTILYVASQRVQNRITHMLNSCKSLAAPAVSTQELRIKNNEDPLYLGQSDLKDVDVDDRRMMLDIRDIYEALEEIEAQDGLDAQLLCPYNWGRTEQDLADELGVTQRLINRRKRRLYKEFLKLTR